MIIGVVYALGWLICAVICVRAVRRDMPYWDGDGLDESIAVAMSSLMALFWPLVFPAFLVYWLSNVETLPERRSRLARERDEYIREQQKKIDELERELGLRRV